MRPVARLDREADGCRLRLWRPRGGHHGVRAAGSVAIASRSAASRASNADLRGIFYRDAAQGWTATARPLQAHTLAGDHSVTYGTQALAGPEIPTRAMDSAPPTSLLTGFIQLTPPSTEIDFSYV